MRAEALEAAGAFEAEAGPGRSRVHVVRTLILRYPLGFVGSIIVALFVFLAVFSPLLTPFDATRSVAVPLLSPSGKYILGTDSLGQDVLSRVLQGSQISMAVAFSVMAINVSVGTTLGLTLSLKNQEYVTAARAVGASDGRIVLRHLLPNVLPYVIVQATAIFGTVILGEAALSFLGLGAAPGTPSWGQDLSGRNRTYFIDAPWVALAPGAAISLTVLGFNLLGDALRDILDPRLRGRQ